MQMLEPQVVDTSWRAPTASADSCSACGTADSAEAVPVQRERVDTLLADPVENRLPSSTLIQWRCSCRMDPCPVRYPTAAPGNRGLPRGRRSRRAVVGRCRFASRLRGVLPETGRGSSGVSQPVVSPA